MTLRTFAQAVQHVAALAQAKLPPTLHDRLARALALVEAGEVWLEDDGVHGAVRGADGTAWYHVNASCSCEDAQFRAFQHLCTHRLGVGLLRRASDLMHQGGSVPDDAPAGKAAAVTQPQLCSIGREAIERPLQSDDMDFCRSTDW